MKLASTADQPVLTALWAACFDDSPADIQQFWNTMWPEITVFTTEDLASMVTAMPVYWQGRKAAYLYAVATDPNRRSEGLCSRLMAEAEDVLRKTGYSYAILAPAEPALFRFYGGMSYETMFHCSRAVFRGGISQLSVRPVSPARYAALRRDFAPESSVEYPCSLLSLQAQAGPLLEIPGLGCAAIEPAEHGYVARELLSLNPQSAADALCAYLGCTLLPARMPGPVPFGMAKSLDGSPLRRAYLGLAFE